MKNLFNLLTLFAVFVIGFFVFIKIMKSDAVTQEEFKDYRQEFTAEIDSIKLELDTIKRDVREVRKDVRTVKANTDTIKKGQVIIYRQIREKKETGFLDGLIKFMD